MMNTNSRRYYAVQWHHGVATTDDRSRPGHSRRYANTISFPTRADRDSWISKGGDYRTQPDFREALSADDAELRRDLAADERDMRDGNFGSRVMKIEDMPEDW